MGNNQKVIKKINTTQQVNNKENNAIKLSEKSSESAHKLESKVQGNKVKKTYKSETAVRENKAQTEIQENNTEKALVKKKESGLRTRNTYLIKPILQTTVGIAFYAASFIVSMAIGYTFIFSMFN